MNQIENIMALAKEYRDAIIEDGVKRQALRTAIEQALAVQPEQALLEAYQKLEGVAGLALEVMVKHRQMKGDAPMGALGDRAIEELRQAFKEIDAAEDGQLLYTAPQQEPVQFDVTIDDNKAKLLWDMLGEDREDLCDVRLLAGFGHSGYGLYVASADYPEEGADLLATITTPQPQPKQEPVEMSPEFTDTARAALLWVLWHHQGGSSPVGQPIRFALGKGAHDRLNDPEIDAAKRWAAQTGATTFEFHKAKPQREWVGLTDEEIEDCWDGYLSDYQLQQIREMITKLQEKNS